ncbi:hypothetical protein SAMN05192529_11958 [Arachidicoccus rhizosphaerae]|uniref:Uncharacterized protein n=1 Tax=Arachidicoccus rhizosphaerae TaxID=551991 RepID=A0A1H4BAD9_9BACT|nr:hypothetical protein SAMN05192529_11958 [Arachidicoccus rhizosphaerae]
MLKWPLAKSDHLKVSVCSRPGQAMHKKSEGNLRFSNIVNWFHNIYLIYKP